MSDALVVVDDVVVLDHDATTALLREVLDAVLPYLREEFGNPSSSHPLGPSLRSTLHPPRRAHGVS